MMKLRKTLPPNQVAVLRALRQLKAEGATVLPSNVAVASLAGIRAERMSDAYKGLHKRRLITMQKHSLTRRTVVIDGHTMTSEDLVQDRRAGRKMVPRPDTEQRLTDLLREAAAGDHILPTLNQIAARLGVASSATIGTAMQRLKNKNVIVYESARGQRYETICVIDGIELRPRPPEGDPVKRAQRQAVEKARRERAAAHKRQEAQTATVQPPQAPQPLPAPASLTAWIFGDPIPGRSALDQRRRA